MSGRCFACGTTGSICESFDETEDGDGDVSDRCGKCGHAFECHEMLAELLPFDEAV